MGPYHPANVTTACGTCNLMKGARRIRGFVEVAAGCCVALTTHQLNLSTDGYHWPQLHIT